MRRLRLTAAAVLGCAALAFVPAVALANSPVVSDCEAHNGLKGHYTTAQLRQALNTMPTTIAEYSNCEQIITNQLDEQLGKGHRPAVHGHGSLPSGSSTPWVPIAIVVGVVVVAGVGFLVWRRRAGDGGSDAPPSPSA